MIVEEFNTKNGLYIFNVTDLKTELHAHPVIEVVIAVQGTFTLCIENTIHSNLQFAIIGPNKKHKLSSADCELMIIMIEHHNKLVTTKLALAGIIIEDGYYYNGKSNSEQEVIYHIIKTLRDGELSSEYDSRVLTAVNYLDNCYLEYSSMTATLKTATNLSESRLSHLFKSNIGISLKRYLIWAKMKSTIKQHLDKEDNIFSSLVSNGFYDQPHFSKNFKMMFGIKPSAAYNSRNLQVLPNTVL